MLLRAPFCAPRQPMKDNHIDMVLHRMMFDLGAQEPDKLGACYIYPPIGSFMEHETGCSLDRGGVIKGLWGMRYCQEGTRKRQYYQVHRRLAAFTRRGTDMEWLTDEIMLPEALESLNWYTAAAPAGGTCPSPAPAGAEEEGDAEEL